LTIFPFMTPCSPTY